MTWRDQVGQERVVVAPYHGQGSIHRNGQSWRIERKHRPREHGWYSWMVGGMRATNPQPVLPDENWRSGGGTLQTKTGVLLGDRLIVSGPNQQPSGERVLLVPPGQDLRSVHVAVAEPPGALRYGECGPKDYILLAEIYVGRREQEVVDALGEGLDTLDGLAGVPLALREAFYLAVESRRIEREIAEETRRRAALQEQIAALAEREAHFDDRARRALRLSGADFLGSSDSAITGEAIVRYRFQGERLACTVRRDTLGIIEAGICLEDHHTGERGDRELTLESLPGVVAEAIRGNKLVVWNRG